MKTILEEAAELTSGARQDVYGHPLENYQALADVFNVLLSRMGFFNDGPGATPGLTAEEVQVLMLGVKLVRLAKDPTHRDTIVDVAGYARTLEMTLDKLGNGGD